MSEPRIVSPEDAREVSAYANGITLRLAHTVATEPKRIAQAERRGAVNALRRMGDLFRVSDGIPGITSRDEGDYCHARADAIENDADL